MDRGKQALGERLELGLAATLRIEDGELVAADPREPLLRCEATLQPPRGASPAS
jgi:hypothetical protein